MTQPLVHRGFPLRKPLSQRLLWLTGALLLAASVQVRPSGLPLPFILGILSVFLPSYVRSSGSPQADLNRPRRPRLLTRAATEAGILLFILTFLMVVPWAWRNQRVLGKWVWTTTNEGVTAYDGFNPGATGASDQAFLRGMPWLNSMSEVERSDVLSQMAHQFIREHPSRSAWLAFVKLRRTWSPFPLSRQFGGWKQKTILFVYALPLDLLVLASLMGPLAAGLRRSAKMLLMTPAAYFSIVHMLSVGSLRYRVPIEPTLAIVASGAVAMCCQRLRKPGPAVTQSA